MKIKYIVGIIIAILAVFLIVNYAHKGGAQGGSAGTNTHAALAQPFSAITEAEFKKFLADKPDTVVIDVRTPQEVAEGTIVPNPKNIDFYKADFEQKIAALDKNKTYFLYCHSGNRSHQSVEKMKALGFTKVYDLKGGIKAWKGKLFTSVSRADIVKSFLGKPSLIVIAGTYCPHCRAAMPEYESKIWDVYHDKMNIFVNVIDGKKFAQKRIAQGTDPALTFKILTGEACDYVPSWILLNKDGEVQESSCGGAKGFDVLISKINELVK